MMSWLMIGGCLLALIVLAVVVLAMMMVMQSGERDTVSTAREGWIQRRSEKDEEGW